MRRQVISTLTLAAAVPLSVSGANEIAASDPSLGNAAWHEGWSSAGVRTVLHWVEAVLLALSSYFSFQAVLTGFVLYSSMSLYLPDMEAKIRFLRSQVAGSPRRPSRVCGTLFQIKCTALHTCMLTY